MLSLKPVVNNEGRVNHLQNTGSVSQQSNLANGSRYYTILAGRQHGQATKPRTLSGRRTVFSASHILVRGTERKIKCDSGAITSLMVGKAQGPDGFRPEF